MYLLGVKPLTAPQRILLQEYFDPPTVGEAVTLTISPVPIKQQGVVLFPDGTQYPGVCIVTTED